MSRMIWVTIGALAGLLFGWVVFERYQQDRIFAGIEAAGVPVGGLKLDQATQKVAAHAQLLTPPQLTLKAGERTLSVSAAELGWQPDPKATAERAFAVGRHSWFERFQAWRGQVKVPLVAKVDPAALKAKLGSIAQSLEYPPTNAQIVLKGERFVVTPDKPGLSLDIAAALEVFSNNPEQTQLEFFPKSVLANRSAGLLQPLADTANELVRPLTLHYTQVNPSGPTKTFSRTLSAAEVAKLLVLREGVSVDGKALSKVIARMAAAYDQLPVNARYVVSTTGLSMRPEVQGWKMNQAKALEAVTLDILKAHVAQIKLPVVAKPAQIRSGDLPKIEEMQLIAEATTYYGGSAWERVQNVHAAARNLDGYIVPAGGMFNFNDAIGSISPENGFQEALVISGGRTIKGVGGGVCQTSTTAFRALYQAGLPIVERNQHAYRVRWYDPVVGYDAAVYQPYLNLRAQNDTPGPIVVRTAYTNSSLTVRLYGIPDGRQVQVSSPVILSRTPHPPAQYIVDRSLRAGEVKQVDWAVDGYRTRISRTVVSASGQARVDYLHSNFRPWRAVYQVAPGSSLASRGRAVASR